MKFADDKAEAKDDSGIKTIVFDKADPIRMHADDGTLIRYFACRFSAGRQRKTFLRKSSRSPCIFL